MNLFLASVILAYGLGPRLISSDVYSKPIEVLYWVYPGVSDEDLETSRAHTNQALAEWAAIPTSALSFVDSGIVRGDGTNQPTKQKKEQLLVVIGNLEELPFGGAAGPFDGNPGYWWGLVADRAGTDEARIRAARHEIGHTLGFLHSTISTYYESSLRPSMHFAPGNSSTLKADDMAAASEAYPSHGWCGGIITVHVHSKCKGVPGVNVVAETEEGTPLVSRITDERGYARLAFVPAGVFRLRVMGGESFRGCCVGVADCCWMVPPYGQAGIQSDNFDMQVVDLGEPLGERGNVRVWHKNIPLGVRPVQLDGGKIPEPVPGQEWSWIVSVDGGVRPLRLDVLEASEGLVVSLIPDPKSTNTGVRGREFIELSGAPVGTISARVTITDSLGTVAEFDIGGGK